MPQTTATCINAGSVFGIQMVNRREAATQFGVVPLALFLLLYFWKEYKGLKCSCRLACWQLYANGFEIKCDFEIKASLLLVSAGLLAARRKKYNH